MQRAHNWLGLVGFPARQRERTALEHKIEEREAELKAAAEHLRAVEADLRQARSVAALLSDVIDQSPVSTWIVDAEGTLIRANDACWRLFGIEPAEAVGRYNILRDPQVLEQGHLEEVRAVFGEGRTASFTIAYVVKAHERVRVPAAEHAILNVTIFPVKDADGRVINAVVKHEDITERVRAEEELDRFFTLATDLLCIAGFDGHLKRLGTAWERLLGYTPEELMSVPFVDFAHPDDRDRVVVETRQLATGVASTGSMYRTRCKDGSYRWIEWTATPNLERGIMYAVGRDVTERRRAEEKIRRLNLDLERRVAERTDQLLQANQQLESANRELEAFSYSVSHDLRAPLRHIAGFASLLQEDLVLPEGAAARRHVRVILDAVTKMGTLIDDLLIFSRMGRTELRNERVSVQELVQEARHELQAEMAGRRIVWTIGTLPEVSGDPSMLRLVLVNLLGNALKYSRGREEAHIEIGCTPEEAESVVFVRDNGVGFDMQYAGKLFGVFQRLHTDAEFEGTGIGLANVQRIVQRHGGRVWAEGVVDRGATIYFSLPTYAQSRQTETR